MEFLHRNASNELINPFLDDAVNASRDTVAGGGVIKAGVMADVLRASGDIKADRKLT